MSMSGFPGGVVVPFAKSQRNMQTSIVQEVRAYWEALRAGRLVPLRSEVDPRGIEGALDQSFILERVAPQVARFRVTGGHLCDVMGMEVRGMPLTAMLSPASRQRAGEALATVFDGPQTAEFILAAETGLGRPELPARLLILPMKSDSGRIDRALGCFVTNGVIGRAPRRFTLIEVLTRPIAAGGPSQASRPFAAIPGLAEAPAAFLPESRSHLRLVKNDG